MQIITREEFLSLPGGVFFQTYTPCVFGELMVKGDTCGNDFIERPVVGEFAGGVEALLADQKQKFEVDFDSYGRNGLFHNDELYAVWSAEDVLALLDSISLLLVAYPVKSDVVAEHLVQRQNAKV